MFRSRTPRLLSLSLLCLGLLAFTGCDDDDDDAANGAGGQGGTAVQVDGAVGGEDGTGGAVEPDAGLAPDAASSFDGSGTCTRSQFTAEEEGGALQETGPLYYAMDDGSPLYSLMVVLVRNEAGLAPGNYDLAGQTMGDCELCVYSRSMCNPETQECAMLEFATEGWVEITEAGRAEGSRITGILHNVEFKQINYDPDTQEQSWVEGARGWCADGYAFDQELANRPVTLGNPVRDFQLQNCETEAFVSSHELGAEQKALWFLAGAGWCSACAEWFPQVIANTAEIPESDLKLVFVIGEDYSGGQPTLEMCREYGRHYEDDASRFYIDHNGTYGFPTLFDNLELYASDTGEFGLPWNALISGGAGNYTYHYADRNDGGETDRDLNGTINFLLSQ